MERPQHGSAEDLSSREPVNGQSQVQICAHSQCTHQMPLQTVQQSCLSAKGRWRCLQMSDKARKELAKVQSKCYQVSPAGCQGDIIVQVKRKAEAMDGVVTAELSDGGPPLKQTKSMGALKIKLKMPRPSQQP